MNSTPLASSGTSDRITAKIQELKEKRGAIILAHNYQAGEVQDIADFVGDSLDLSIRAFQTDARVIVFCGVHFMAETASLLCPDRTVLLPDENAGCPMADMITAAELRKEKEQNPDAAVVCYVNSSAAVKAECDICLHARLLSRRDRLDLVDDVHARHDLAEHGVVEQFPKLEGRQMIMVLAPKKKK